MSRLQPFIASLLAFIGFETITLSDLNDIIKIICQVVVAFFTCLYLYRKTKNLKK